MKGFIITHNEEQIKIGVEDGLFLKSYQCVMFVMRNLKKELIDEGLLNDDSVAV